MLCKDTPDTPSLLQADSPLGNPTSGGYSYRNVPVLYPGGEKLAGGEFGNSITRSTSARAREEGRALALVGSVTR